MIFSFVKVIVPSSLSIAVTFANGSNISPTFNVTSFAEMVGAVFGISVEPSTVTVITFLLDFPSLSVTL